MNATPRFDLHVHSRHSPDSSESVEAIVARAASLGLRGIALTDHNSIEGYPELAELAPRWPDLLLVPAVEVSTREGHLLLYGVGELPPVHAPIDEVLRWAEARGIVPVLSHPFRWSHGVGPAVADRVPVPAVETRNGHNGPGANHRAERLRSTRGLGATGGSDAHRASEVGRCTTEFARPIETVSDLLAELRAGRSTARGVELDASARFRLSVATFARRAARGFRPI